VGSFLNVNIVSGLVVQIMYGLTGAVVLALLLVRPGKRWSRRGWLVTSVLAAAVGAAIGLWVEWYFIDTQNVLGMSPTPVTRVWVSLGFALVAIVTAGLWRATWKRRIASVGALVLVILTPAMAINIDFGQYVSLNAALGVSAFAENGLPAIPPAPIDGRPAYSTWQAPVDMPAEGTVSSVAIPGLISGFTARNAIVYLPPAALTANPPTLPVVMLLSGQPGSPEDALLAGNLRQELNSYASAHGGLAPIVISPDQLGSRSSNPMCLDSPLGNSDTYLTKDVRNWVTANLPVETDAAHWAIAGFSQGGTCAIQLGATHPDIFGTLIDVSGEVDVNLGDEKATTTAVFNGNAAAYAAAQPLDILAAGAPFTDTYAIFAVGANDATFKPQQQKVEAAAAAAGMHTTYLEIPDSAHDWHTAGIALTRAFDATFSRWGLAATR
jgi:S-formylglutathione hydrolase FrmB/uncharacterized membrane protein YeaQ/YmgE (transglycosylase-associated protein family)